MILRPPAIPTGPRGPNLPARGRVAGGLTMAAAWPYAVSALDASKAGRRNPRPKGAQAPTIGRFLFARCFTMAAWIGQASAWPVPLGRFSTPIQAVAIPASKLAASAPFLTKGAKTMKTTTTGEIRPNSDETNSNIIPFLRRSNHRPLPDSVVFENMPDLTMPKKSSRRIFEDMIERRREEDFMAAKGKGLLDPPSKPIKSRSDLRFTRRDENNLFCHWFVPDEMQCRFEDNNKLVGNVFFDEVRLLAAHDPKEAFLTLFHAWRHMGRNGARIEDGFMRCVMEAAIAGILGHPESIPTIPTKTRKTRKDKGQTKKNSEVKSHD